MSDDLSRLTQIQTQRITGIFSKREGREREKQEFARHLKGDEGSEGEESTGEHGSVEQESSRPHHHRGAPRGKLIDYEA